MDRLITSFDELRSHLESGLRCIYLYSGGLDGSFMLANLPERLRQGSLALTVDLGGGKLGDRSSYEESSGAWYPDTFSQPRR
jgi:PP-loop superfamily ATP-utilizing enzyme